MDLAFSSKCETRPLVVGLQFQPIKSRTGTPKAVNHQGELHDRSGYRHPAQFPHPDWWIIETFQKETFKRGISILGPPCS